MLNLTDKTEYIASHLQGDDEMNIICVKIQRKKYNCRMCDDAPAKFRSD